VYITELTFVVFVSTLFLEKQNELKNLWKPLLELAFEKIIVCTEQGQAMLVSISYLLAI